MNSPAESTICKEAGLLRKYRVSIDWQLCEIPHTPRLDLKDMAERFALSPNLQPWKQNLLVGGLERIRQDDGRQPEIEFNDSTALKLLAAANLSVHDMRLSVGVKNEHQPAAQATRDVLNDRGKALIANPEQLNAFKANEARFERRVEARGLSREVISDTYEQLGRLLEDVPGAPTSLEERTLVAQQLMEHLAEPTGVDQGTHGTCGYTALEARLLTRNPVASVKLIADVATTGKYCLTDGKVVSIDPTSLHPDPEARLFPLQEDRRSYASQLFQVTAVNIRYRNEPFFYRQNPTTSRERGITGDELVDRITGQTKPGAGGAASLLQLAEVNRLIVGPENNVSFLSALSRKSPPDIEHVTSEGELHSTLERLKSQKAFPVIIDINDHVEPFGSDWRVRHPGQKQDGAGWHVVSITDYDSNTRTAAIDNQWGNKYDHPHLNLHSLYSAMSNEGKGIFPELGMPNQYDYLPSQFMMNYVKQWTEKPVLTATETGLAGIGVMGGYKLVRAFPKASIPVAAAGLYAFYHDGKELLHSDSTTAWKHGIACVSDLATAAGGTVVAFSPAGRKYGLIAMGLGLTGRALCELLPAQRAQ